MGTNSRYADPVDPAKYGQYRIARRSGNARPLYRFSERISADGTTAYPAEPGRYHLYAGWFCPWSQRVAIQRLLNGLQDAVSISYVDDERDGRGWAFREARGPDPVNGFRLLREAYESTEPGFDGHVSVPVLWDRESNRIVSNRYHDIGIDLATQFNAHGNGADTYPPALRSRIEELDRWLGPDVNHGVNEAAADSSARRRLLAAFGDLNAHLARSRYLLGGCITEADVRLWVTLVRYDVGYNASGTINPGGLREFGNLWYYARDLYGHPAFRDTTDFTSFSVAGAVPPDWQAPHHRAGLSGPGHASA